MEIVIFLQQNTKEVARILKVTLFGEVTWKEMNFAVLAPMRYQTSGSFQVRINHNFS